MLAQFTAELAALKQSVADQLRIVAESQQKHAEEQQKNAGLQESIEGVRKELGELREAHQKALHEIDMFRRWAYGSRRERFTEDPRQKHMFDVGSLVKSGTKTGSLPRGRLWVYSSEDDAPYTCYDFTVSRHRDGPAAMLKGWSGFLHADACRGNQSIVRRRVSSLFKIAG